MAPAHTQFWLSFHTRQIIRSYQELPSTSIYSTSSTFGVLASVMVSSLETGVSAGFSFFFAPSAAARLAARSASSAAC